MSIVLAMLLIIFGMLFHFTKVDLQKDANALLHKIAQDGLQVVEPESPGTDLQYFTVRINIYNEFSAYGYTAFDLDDHEFIREIVNDVLENRADEG